MAFMPRASHVLQWRVQIDARPQGGANRKKLAPVRIVGWQLACMKLESLVSRVSYNAVNVFLSLVHTARQVMGVGSTRSRFANPQGKRLPTVSPMTGTKS